MSLGTGRSWLTGLSFILLFWISVEGLIAPVLETDPNDVKNLRENVELKLNCTFTVQAVRGNLVLVRHGDNPDIITPLFPTPTAVNGLDNVMNITDTNIGNTVVYSMKFVTTRAINNLRFSCAQELVNGSLLSTTSHSFVVKYGPLKNASDVMTVCVSITSLGSTADVSLNASQIVEDPGNPTTSVMWRWEDNDMTISKQVNGQYGHFLTVMAKRSDNDRSIIALYDNNIGHTMQKFTLCVKSVPSAPKTLTCDRIAIGYNCTWNSPNDNGGEAVSRYCYGHIKRRNTSCPTSSVCQLNPTRAVNNSLEEGTPYVFYVYAVNSVGKGSCSIDMVTTLLGAPTGISIQPKRTSLLVKWSRPVTYDNGDDLQVRGYYIEYKKQGSLTTYSQVMAMGSEVEKEIPNLQSNTTYRVLVFARSDIGNGNKSSLMTATTLKEGKVSQVQNVQATATSPTEIRVTWDKPDAGGAGFSIKQYIVNVYLQGSTTAEKSVEVDGTKTTVTITGLSEGTAYTIEVSANNGQNTGTPSDGTSVTTQPKESVSGNNSAVIGGAVAGAIVVISLLVVIIVYYRCSKNARAKDDDRSQRTEALTASSAYGITISSSTSNQQDSSPYATVVDTSSARSSSSMTSNPAYSTTSRC